MASLAAILAIGKPVALDANAELRETRGFISMTTSRPVRGSTANCTLDPPVSTPISRMIATAASRMIWYSLSVRVWAGAIVMLSPVCTPIGSRFSIEQMMTTLSLRSRITSSSNSFQPAIDSSTRVSWVGESSSAQRSVCSSSSRLCAKPAPVPPSVRDGRMMSGKPISSPTRIPSSSERTQPLRGRSRPMFAIACLKRSRSSAFFMAPMLAPISSTPYCSSTPWAARSRARLRPVCPPIVGSSASGRSAAMIAAAASTFSGSI